MTLSAANRPASASRPFGPSTAPRISFSTRANPSGFSTALASRFGLATMPWSEAARPPSSWAAHSHTSASRLNSSLSTS
ncbi:hypothetical protein [Carbonactinospora thermoautotrophica]|uniref:hypothetical protein n=1 Tax=Carbonactinospora thermoautotrophica TaxID=1469144 RepID=UPI0011470C37|nr:hypothetical protein [Carbonactinospora thermoautotrophica]